MDEDVHANNDQQRSRGQRDIRKYLMTSRCWVFLLAHGHALDEDSQVGKISRPQNHGQSKLRCIPMPHGTHLTVDWCRNVHTNETEYRANKASKARRRVNLSSEEISPDGRGN